MPLPRAEFVARRARLLDAIGAGVVLVPSAPVHLRNNDVEHEYRQDSDFYYLTGFDEPESVLLLSSVHPHHRTVMFVRPRDPDRETWDGPRAGVEGVLQWPGVDAVFPIGELSVRLPEYLGDARRLHYRLGLQPEFDRQLLAAIDVVRRRARRGVFAPSEIVDFSQGLHELRLRKSHAELGVMAKAAAISAEAHERALEVAVPGRYEYEIEAEMLRVFRARGAARPAYSSIVGSGPNATILHHRRNDRQLCDGDLLLIDAGAEYDYYASDVTRTFPVSGRFSDAQRAIYDVVLEAQLAGIACVRPGITYLQVHDQVVQVLCAGLIRLGLVEGPVAEAIEHGRFKPFYMHGTSHWLGMDVHDVGAYYAHKQPRRLEEGMVLTVEPGIYIGADAPVDARFAGIGVRIEDDIAVTETGHRNLTEAIPKDPGELERRLAARAGLQR